MKPQTSTSAIAWTLLVVFVITLFPSASASQPQRRGKNGGASSSPSPPPSSLPTSANPKATDAAKKSSSTATDNASRAAADKAPTEKAVADEDQQEIEKNPPKSFEDERLNQSQGKRQPLPFDRPPSGGNAGGGDAKAKASPGFDRPNSSTGSASGAAPGSGNPSSNSSVNSSSPNSGAASRPPVTRPGVSTPSRESATSSGRQPSWESNDRDERRSAPPVLRREPDSPNAPINNPRNGERGAPPVLTRPTDPQNTNPNSGSPSPTATTRPNHQPSTDDDEPIKLEGTLVNIPVLVSDRSNRYVGQLNARDFQLYEDGVQQEVAFFGNEQVPFSVALLLDMSPSVADNQTAIQDAAIEFVRQLRPQDRVMVISFDRKVDFLTDFTSDRRLLERAIRSTSIGSGTSVYEAVYRAVDERLRRVEGRKALILFSDGEDTTSRGFSYEDAVDIVTESDVLVYGMRYAGTDGGNIRVNPWPRNPVPNIGIPLPFPFPFPMPRRRRGGNLLPQFNHNAAPTTTAQWPRRRGDFMTDITNAGGGPVFDAQTIHDYRGLASKIAEELRHVYVISYYPTNALSNGGYRAIRMRVKNRDDIAIRHRKGYNAKDMARGT